MTVMTDMDSVPAPDPNMGMNMELEPVVESPENNDVVEGWEIDPTTASWAPMMAEVRLTTIESLI
jgi:hypothetical protein